MGLGLDRQVAVNAEDHDLRAYVTGLGGKAVGEFTRGYGSVRVVFVVFEGVGGPVCQGGLPLIARTRRDVDDAIRA